MVKAAVILSGCGHKDGAEIRESVLALLYLDQHHATVQCFAPDCEQTDVVNHLTGETTKESRNVLVEAARIARGDIQPLTKLNPADFDALVIPGGFGAAKNLSDLATKGPDATVRPEFRAAVLGFLKQQKPIGAICIAPAVLAAAVKGEYAPTLTIGDDTGTAAAITAMGSTHKNCTTADFVYDETTRIASCSAYMRDDALRNVAKGIEQMVAKVVSIATAQKQGKAA